MRKILKTSLWSIGLMMLLIIGCYLSVSLRTWDRTFDNIDDVQEYTYGLLLGTSPFTKDGARNFYFENRIKSASELYAAGKIRKIIVSGGNYSQPHNGNFHEKGYDEPRAMSDSLIAHGVSPSDIIRDYEGTRTLRSIVKVKETYGLDSVILISQKYHNERAIVQADKYGLKAIGYNAPHSHILQNRIKNILREFPARVRLYLDLWFGKKPQFFYTSIEVVPHQYEDWFYDPSMPVRGYWTFRSLSDSGYGFLKLISSDSPDYNGHLVYYNSSHGYWVTMPKGMGFNQRGENIMGAHDNEFYNGDTTLVLCASGMHYDPILVDVPNYSDSLKKYEHEYLANLGNHQIQRITQDELISEGVIEHTKDVNPPADRFIRKRLLRKDIEDRECEMALTIFYNDTLAYRYDEFMEIINLFPLKPMQAMQK